MNKFETEKTLMYNYLIGDLEDQIEEAEERIEILEDDFDFDNAIAEHKQVIKWREQLNHLKKYLEIEENTHCNKPHTITISAIDKFRVETIADEFTTLQLDDGKYYYKGTGILLKDWKYLKENTEYIIGNLTLKLEDGELLSQYPQETMWWTLSQDDINTISKTLKSSEVYYKN